MKRARGEPTSPEPPGPRPGHTGTPAFLRSRRPPSPRSERKYRRLPLALRSGERKGGTSRQKHDGFTVQAPAAEPRPNGFHGDGGVVVVVGGGSLAGPAPRVRGRGCPGQAAVGGRSPCGSGSGGRDETQRTGPRRESEERK